MGVENYYLDLSLYLVLHFKGRQPVPVAQRIERLPSKQRVVGSNPSRDALAAILTLTRAVDGNKEQLLGKIPSK